MTSKQLARLALLSSLCVALRLAFGAFPNIKPITAIFLILLVYLTWWEVVIVMALTMLVTGFYLGFGIWVLWQILAYAIVLLVWGFLRRLVLSRWPIGIAWQAVLSGLMPFLYSLVMGICSSLTYGFSLWPYMLNGLVFDALHAASTVCFYPIVYHSLRRLYHHEKNIF